MSGLTLTPPLLVRFSLLFACVHLLDVTILCNHKLCTHPLSHDNIVYKNLIISDIFILTIIICMVRILYPPMSLLTWLCLLSLLNAVCLISTIFSFMFDVHKFSLHELKRELAPLAALNRGCCHADLTTELKFAWT